MLVRVVGRRERLLDQAIGGQIEQQALLFPTTLEVSGAQHQSLQEAEELLRGLGFSIVPFGPDAIRIDALPALLGDIAADQLVREILDELSHEELQNRSGARLSFNENCSELTAPNLLTN